jgi:hypothetical protein
LRWHARGVPLLTLVPPDATPGQERSAHIHRGRKAKDRKGGRPPKRDRAPGWRKRRKSEWLPMVLDRHRGGASSRDIAAEVTAQSGVRIAHASISRWIREAAKGAH